MGRRTTKQQLADMVSRLRKEIPDIVLRTTLISGFPGETQEDHEELAAFVDEMEFDRLGVFAYSPEEDTPAALMPDQVSEEMKQERRDELMELQQEIAFERAKDCLLYTSRRGLLYRGIGDRKHCSQIFDRLYNIQLPGGSLFPVRDKHRGNPPYFCLLYTSRCV